MNTLTKALGAATVGATLAVAGATGTVAKGHDQNNQSGLNNTERGQNVGSETVGNAQGLGAARGNGNGPASTPAGANPGSSENAGRD